MAFNRDLFQSYQLGAQDYSNIYCYQATEDNFATVAASGYFNNVYTFVKTGDKLICNTETAGLSFSGTFRVSGTTVAVDWDRTLFFETQMSDISANTTSWITAPPAGIITQVYAVKWSAITVDSAVITFSIGAAEITGSVVTVTVAGDPGTKYSATPTAANATSGSNSVKAVSGGESTDTAIATVGFKIICPTQI